MISILVLELIKKKKHVNYFNLFVKLILNMKSWWQIVKALSSIGTCRHYANVNLYPTPEISDAVGLQTGRKYVLDIGEYLVARRATLV